MKKINTLIILSHLTEGKYDKIKYIVFSAHFLGNLMSDQGYLGLPLSEHRLSTGLSTVSVDSCRQKSALMKSTPFTVLRSGFRSLYETILLCSG
jgi:hypothetical protein